MDEEQRRLAEEFLFAEKKKPSFAKLLYLGLFDAKAVLPYPEADAAERLRTEELLNRLKSFCQKAIDPDEIDREGKIPEAVIKGLGELGILGLTIPEEYGGLGMTQRAY
jgi:alkylation response protein AidB-like acyl-CoA dehydrogenase